jgi:hypothetical protein
VDTHLNDDPAMLSVVIAQISYHGKTIRTTHMPSLAADAPAFQFGQQGDIAQRCWNYITADMEDEAPYKGGESRIWVLGKYSNDDKFKSSPTAKRSSKYMGRVDVDAKSHPDLISLSCFILIVE